MALAIPPFPARTLLVTGKGSIVTHELFERDFQYGEWYVQIQSIVMTNLPPKAKFALAVSCDCIRSQYHTTSGQLKTENQALFAVPIETKENTRESFSFCPPVYFRLTHAKDSIGFKLTSPTDIDLKNVSVHIFVYLYKKK